ncbi:MAG TPA: HAMP domain-containing sensor histidine kinase [Burkholderiales bacterium]|nr:HAMP domain-containing sensor histidine kinase [Burkholderiales bacterium]
MRRLDLRLRIAAVLATVCIAVVGALGVTLYMASEDMEEGLVAQIVGEEIDSLIERTTTLHAPPPPHGPNLQYYVLRRPADYEHIAPALRSLPPGQHIIGENSNERFVAVRELDGVRYIVSYDAAPHELREQSYKRLTALALASAALVAVVLGYWLAGVLTQQLTDLAAAVKQLAPDERHPPLERPDHDREVAALAHALDEYHLRIMDMIQREQEFTANASHELRTPLTAIRTSSELLAAEPGLSDKGLARLGMITTAAEQMTDRIEALLYLARQRPATVVETVELRECVTEAAAPCRDEIARKGLAFEVPIEPDAVVTLDRKALQLVLANLIKNAVRYTERGFVRVSYDARRLTVEDSGKGIAPQHLPQVFERFYRGASDVDGLGLGLAIVRRICDDLGWKIEVESKPGVGSQFSVVLT